MAHLNKNKTNARPVAKVYRSPRWLAMRKKNEGPKVCYLKYDNCTSKGVDNDHKIKWRLGGSMYGKLNLGWACKNCHTIKTHK